MGQGRRRMGVRGAATMTGLVVLLVATACETPAPTGVRNAMDRAIGAQRAGAQEVDAPLVRPGTLTFSGDTLIIGGIRTVVPGREPLIFVNDELINPDGQDASIMDSIDREDIERIEVIKGAKARESFGPRGLASGVVQIYLKGYDRPEGSPLADHLAAGELTERAREQAARASELERALEREQNAADRIRDSERALAAEARAHQLRLETTLEQRHAEELEARMRAEEASLASLAESSQELRLREKALMEEAMENAGAAGAVRSLESIESRAMLRAQIEELTERVEQLERMLEERARRRS